VNTEAPASTTVPAGVSATSHRYERYFVTAGVVLLIVGCYLVFRPFLTAFLWGAIIGVSTRGLYHFVLRLVGGKRSLAATLTALALVLVLLIPIGAVAINVAAKMPAISAKFDELLQGGLKDPPAWLAGIPLVGKRAVGWWQSVAGDPTKLREDLRPFIKPVREFVTAAVGGIAVGLLEFALALVIAGLLYARGDEIAAMLDRILGRLAGQRGRRQIAVVRSTVRGVFRGIIGTCAVQAVLAIIGFWIAGVPGAFVLGMATFFLSVVPGGPIILWLPAAFWLNAQGSTGWAIFMGIWGLVMISGSDNVVRPLLIGKGVEAPLALVFLGVIGGILAFGFLGLFIGPTLLVVAYNLVDEWMKSEAAPPRVESALPVPGAGIEG